MKILEIFRSVNFYQIGICFMFFLLIVKTGISLYQYNKEKDSQIKELELKHKRTQYNRFVEVANFDPGFELFCILNDEMITLLFNVALVGYINKMEFAGIYQNLYSGHFNFRDQNFITLYKNWIEIKDSFKTEKINSKIFFEMFFKK